MFPIVPVRSDSYLPIDRPINSNRNQADCIGSISNVKTRLLLIVSAVLEVGIGLALLVSPALAVPILIGAPFETTADSIVGRVGGAALLALGAACWLARNDERAPAATGLIVSMLLYNVAAAVVLAYAGVGLRLFGIGLWPAFVLHVVMAVWCLTNVAPSLETRRPRGRELT
jgi:hypothetical protein